MTPLAIAAPCCDPPPCDAASHRLLKVCAQLPCLALPLMSPVVSAASPGGGPDGPPNANAMCNAINDSGDGPSSIIVPPLNSISPNAAAASSLSSPSCQSCSGNSPPSPPSRPCSRPAPFPPPQPFRHPLPLPNPPPLTSLSSSSCHHCRHAITTATTANTATAPPPLGALTDPMPSCAEIRLVTGSSGLGRPLKL